MRDSVSNKKPFVFIRIGLNLPLLIVRNSNSSSGGSKKHYLEKKTIDYPIALSDKAEKSFRNAKVFFHQLIFLCKKNLALFEYSFNFSELPESFISVNKTFE